MTRKCGGMTLSKKRRTVSKKIGEGTYGRWTRWPTKARMNSNSDILEGEN